MLYFCYLSNVLTEFRNIQCWRRTILKLHDTICGFKKCHGLGKDLSSDKEFQVWILSL